MMTARIIPQADHESRPYILLFVLRSSHCSIIQVANRKVRTLNSFPS